MATGDFTKEEADHVLECIEAMFKSLPKSKKFECVGELNDALCFVSAAKRVAPEAE